MSATSECAGIAAVECLAGALAAGTRGLCL
jgi:hypothetical protein